MWKRLLFAIVFIVTLPFVCLCLMFSVVIMTPVIAVGWFLYGNKKDWLIIWISPGTFFVELPYKLLKIENVSDL